jgi:uncharacterized phage-associated protein
MGCHESKEERHSMTVRVRTFDPQKAVEAVLYVATRTQEPGFHKISKLLYFADRLHLERFGRLIIGDEYAAMRLGPVPSRVYDLLKAAAGRGESPWGDLALDAFEVIADHVVRPKRDPDIRALARSEIACLDEALAQHGGKSFDELTHLSHDEAWKSADENERISLEAIVRTFPNAEQILDHLKS